MSTKPDDPRPGFWEFRHHPIAGSYMYFNCPCGCEFHDAINVVEANEKDKFGGWLWDGNEQKPTLTPSLRRNTPCKWHGFLTSGVWRAEGDSGKPNAPDIYQG